MIFMKWGQIFIFVFLGVLARAKANDESPQPENSPVCELVFQPPRTLNRHIRDGVREYFGIIRRSMEKLEQFSWDSQFLSDRVPLTSTKVLQIVNLAKKKNSALMDEIKAKVVERLGGM